MLLLRDKKSPNSIFYTKYDFWRNNVCTPFFQRVVLDSVRRLIGLPLQLNFESLKCLDHTPTIFQLKYTAPCIINQSSVGGVATHTGQRKAITNMASRSHRPSSREPLHRIQWVCFMCQGNSPQHNRAEQNFRLAIVWNKGVWYNTDSSWRIRSLYTQRF